MKNKIKQTILIIMLFQVIISPIFSQESSTNDHVSIPKNQFGVSLGIGSCAGLLSPRNILEILADNPDYPYFFSVNYSNRSMQKSPTFNLSYFRNFNHFLTLEVTASITKMTSQYFDDWYHYYSSYQDYFLTLMIGPRFYWYNSKNVRLYSSTATGFGIDFNKGKHLYNNYYEEDPFRLHYYFDFQISPIGVVLYDRFNLELGFGGTGFFKLGIIF